MVFSVNKIDKFSLLIQSRDKLLWALRTMSPGESTEQLIRQSDKISKSMERAARESRINKVYFISEMKEIEFTLSFEKF